MVKHTITPYEEQLLDQVHKLEAELREAQEYIARLLGEITPEGQCAFCGKKDRFLLRFNTSAEPIYLQCPSCLAPHRVPCVITAWGRDP